MCVYMPAPALRFSVCLLLTSVAEAHVFAHARAIAVASVRHTGSVAAAPAAALDGNPVSRRLLLRGAVWATGVYSSVGSAACASAYTVSQVKPSEKETYEVAQKGDGALRVLWVGAGSLSGVFKGLFPAGNEVVAVDLVRPDRTDYSAATTYAAEHGYQLRFEQGDATKLKFPDGSFDVVVSSMFLCQGSELDVPVPNWEEIVVSEIQRVLKPGGRFGFYEHIEDIDKVIVDKVFGERSVIRVQAYPERTNVIAGVVRKV